MFSKFVAIAAVAGLSFGIPAAAAAQEAMGGDAMSPMMMSDEDLQMCLEQAGAITFPGVAMAAEQACHQMHNGEDAMGGDAMSGEAM